MRIPKPYLIIWLALSTLLNLLGIASIIQGFVDWAGFLAQAVHTYQQLVRDPVLSVVLHVWPPSWPKFPGWLVDLLIIQSSFFISNRLFMAFEPEKYLLTFKELGALQPGLVFLGGPFVPFIQMIRLRRKALREISMAEAEAEEAEAAERQFKSWGSTNQLLLSREGWIALDKRQMAGLQAVDAARSAFIKLNIYYCCYMILVACLLFIAYQFGHWKVG